MTLEPCWDLSMEIAGKVLDPRAQSSSKAASISGSTRLKLSRAYPTNQIHMSIFDELNSVKEMVGLLFEQRSSAAIDGLEGDNSILERGEKSLVRLEELINDLDPQGVK